MFYIKPQPFSGKSAKKLSCILFVFYIKPQHKFVCDYELQVVSYSCSTSNHNTSSYATTNYKLYLIRVLHQTTTNDNRRQHSRRCILFVFYIKPQPVWNVCICRCRCILFVFYIKPQQQNRINYVLTSCILFVFYIKPQQTSSNPTFLLVVSYSCSTSNHNIDDRGASTL